MRACRWLFVAVLALGMGLQSSAGAAEGPEVKGAPEASQCQAPGLALGKALGLDPVEPMFLSCSAHATCSNGSPVSCSVASGSCTGVDGSCPENGYVQCGSTYIACPPYCPSPGPDCVQSCSVNSDCTSHCAGPGFCSSSCTSKPYIKKCICVA